MPGAREYVVVTKGRWTLPSPFATENTEFSMVVPAPTIAMPTLPLKAIDGVVAAVSKLPRILTPSTVAPSPLTSTPPVMTVSGPRASSVPSIPAFAPCSVTPLVRMTCSI